MELRLKCDFLLWRFQSLSKKIEVKEIRKPDNNVFGSLPEIMMFRRFLNMAKIYWTWPNLEHFQKSPKIVRESQTLPNKTCREHLTTSQRFPKIPPCQGLLQELSRGNGFQISLKSYSPIEVLSIGIQRNFSSSQIKHVCYHSLLIYWAGSNRSQAEAASGRGRWEAAVFAGLVGHTFCVWYKGADWTNWKTKTKTKIKGWNHV